MVLACWNGCEIDRSGLSSGVDRPNGSGGHMSPAFGTGGIVGSGSGGSSIHFGTGGLGTGGHVTGGASGGHDAPGSGGAAGTVGAGSGGNDSAGQGTGGHIFGSGGGAGQTTGTGGGAGSPADNGGGGGTRSGGRGGFTVSTGGTGGTGNSGSGGRWSGGAGRAGSTGGADGGLPMCDPSIRDKDSCDFGAPDCRKTCGVSALATKPCTCTNHQWSCGDCVYPSGDYSCYQLPMTPIQACPSNTVNGMTACFGNCTLCSNYMDTTGMPKMGYCACNQDPGDNSRLYHCASSAEWPPQ